MSTPVATITDRVRARVRSERVDLHRDPDAAERLVREELRVYAERSLSGALPRIHDEVRTHGEVLAGLTGYGALQPYFDDAEVEGSGSSWQALNPLEATCLSRGCRAVAR